LVAHSLDLVISSGFSCALTASRIGALVIGTDVVWHGGSRSSGGTEAVIPCAAPWRLLAEDVARQMAVECRIGRMVTVDHVLWQAAQKQSVARLTGAVGLDMESAALGQAAVTRGVPFLVIRTASDLLDEDLPLDFNLFLHPRGWPRGLLSCLLHPTSWSGLERLRRQAAVASDALGVFLAAYLDRVSASVSARATAPAGGSAAC
jgi:adenosylhomocysteine nucleosidase